MSKKYIFCCLAVILIFFFTYIVLLTIIEEKRCNEDYKLIELDESISVCYPKIYGDPEIEIINKEKTRDCQKA